MPRNRNRTWRGCIMNFINRISEFINLNIEYFILGITLAVLLLFIISIIILVKTSKLKKKYLNFIKGASGSNLEEIIHQRFADIDQLKESNILVNNKIDVINDTLLGTYQKLGVVKYDAFREMGGKLSYVLVLLDKNNNGFLLNSVHSSREGCYTYLKEIIKGESFLVLSEDEKEALKQAKQKDHFLD